MKRELILFMLILSCLGMGCTRPAPVRKAHMCTPSTLFQQEGVVLKLDDVDPRESEAEALAACQSHWIKEFQKHRDGQKEIWPSEWIDASPVPREWMLPVLRAVSVKTFYDCHSGSMLVDCSKPTTFKPLHDAWRGILPPGERRPLRVAVLPGVEEGGVTTEFLSFLAEWIRFELTDIEKDTPRLVRYRNLADALAEITRPRLRSDLTADLVVRFQLNKKRQGGGQVLLALNHLQEFGAFRSTLVEINLNQVPASPKLSDPGMPVMTHGPASEAQWKATVENLPEAWALAVADVLDQIHQRQKEGADLSGQLAHVRELCLAGHGEACAFRGTMVSKGMGLEDSPASAEEIWAQACAGGHAPACVVSGRWELGQCAGETRCERAGWAWPC